MFNPPSLRSEREMKRVVLNRKNSLLGGNPRGGRTAAILVILTSLTNTCHRHSIDPQHYLTQLLLNLPQSRPATCQSGCPTSENSVKPPASPACKTRPLSLSRTCASRSAHRKYFKGTGNTFILGRKLGSAGQLSKVLRSSRLIHLYEVDRHDLRWFVPLNGPLIPPGT
jgi:hypothetical protein